MGQDYKGGGWNHDRNKKFGGKWGTNKAFAAQDEWEDADDWGDETGYYEDDDYPDEAYVMIGVMKLA